jgi:hypothetical protein
MKRHLAGNGLPPSRPTVGFDESGNTGPDLLSEAQPVFVLASIGLSEEIASSLLGSPLGQEHHSIVTRQSRAGQQRILEILSAPELTQGTVKIAVMHKKFMVVSKLVDLLIEPVAARLGIDLYQDGLHLALSNLIYTTWPVLDPEGAQELWASFVKWARRPHIDSALSLTAAIRRMSIYAPKGVFDLLMVAAARLDTTPDEFAGAGDISDLDPAGPSLVGLLHDWSSQLGSFDVVHDNSYEISRWIPHLEQLATREPIEVQLWNGDHIGYPLDVGHIALDHSEHSAQIQLADLVAGAGTIAFDSLVRTFAGRKRAFAHAILDSRLPHWRITSSVWPTPDFTPETLGTQSGGTPWIIDRLIL